MKLLLPSIFLIIISCSNMFALAQDNYPGFDVIGRGYNVFGEYANSKSISDYPLFDFSKMSKSTNAHGHSIPKFVNLTNISDHIISTIEGSSHQQYIENLSTNIGLAGRAYFFKASIEQHLGTSQSTSQNLFYYTYMDINTKWKINLDTRNLDSVINYLDPQFKSDLEKLPPSELFETYGTHFIANAYLGGRIDYTTVSEMNELTNSADIRTALNAKFIAIRGNLELQESYKSLLQTLKVIENLKVVGGNSEYATGIYNYTQYVKWADGISTSPVLCGFDSKSLKPIWLLTKNQTRSQELENYFTNSILPKYPVPANYALDPILDNTELTQEFTVNLYAFAITHDCDYYILTGDEAGDFFYSIKVYANGELIDQVKTPEGRVHSVWGGDKLIVSKQVHITIPLSESSEIKVQAKLTENDDLQYEEMGSYVMTHKFPFAISDLNNVKLDGKLYWSQRYYNDTDCDAIFYYQIYETDNKTAIEFGNKGWEEYLAGNYEQALYYSKEALKLDNSLWYVQYNVALIYLIQENPRAFEKYKTITNLCPSKATISAALKDIKDHESKFGDLANSEPVELLLSSKL